jgi:mRNA interferase RelE/StbE
MRSLDRQVQANIIREVRILEENPYTGKALHGDWKGVYSLRIGDYRVLYQIKGKEVNLLTVGHRSQIYRM